MAEYNNRLALGRTETIRRALLRLDVPDDHPRTLSLGCRAPQCVTRDEPCRQKNRRVHFRAARALPDSTVKRRYVRTIIEAIERGTPC